MDVQTTRLMITDRPYGIWFAGAFFCGCGIAMMLTAEAPLGLGVLLFFIGGALLTFTPITTIVIDRSAGIVLLRRSALLYRRVEEIILKDIVDIQIQFSRSYGGRSHRLAFLTQNGSLIPLTSYYNGARSGKERQAARLRDFLDLDA
jgi:hypothetical protein